MKVELRSLICARWEQIAASGLIKRSIYLQFLYFPAPSFPLGLVVVVVFQPKRQTCPQILHFLSDSCTCVFFSHALVNVFSPE